MTHLPRSLDELRGLRAARWIRESTAGQYDHYGPASQREQQDRFIERWGLIDTGLVYEVAQSGRTVWRSTSMATMVDDLRAGRFDVLLTGYSDRWQRNLRRTLELLEDELHPNGGALVMCDRRILSSDPSDWDELISEAVGAEKFSRRLAERVREGYAAKRRRLADPGGNAPFGFRRAGAEHVLEPDPSSIGRAIRVFELSAEGHVDRDVAAAVALPLPTVRGILRNPIYAGRLADGTPTRFGAVVDAETWQHAIEARDRRRRNRGNRAKGRPYALSMLACAACGRRLVGDGGRYRHLDACERFRAAAPAGRRRPGQHRDLVGASYRAELYEAGVAAVLARVAAGAGIATDVVARLGAAEPAPDRLALARIERERRAAAERFVRDRDQDRLTAAMARLDAEEQGVRTVKRRPPVPAARAAAYLRNLGDLWTKAPDSRRQLAESLFDRVEVMGLRRIRIVPSQEAIESGLAAAFMAGAGGWSEPGQARANANHLLVTLTPGIRTRIEVALPASEPLRIVRSA